MPAHLKLPVVVQAGNLVGLCLCFAERRKQEACKDGDDRDDDQQLDQREATVGHAAGRICVKQCFHPVYGFRNGGKMRKSVGTFNKKLN